MAETAATKATETKTSEVPEVPEVPKAQEVPEVKDEPTVDRNAYVEDPAPYSNTVAGGRYIVRGRLVDANGKPLQENGE